MAIENVTTATDVALLAVRDELLPQAAAAAVRLNGLAQDKASDGDVELSALYSGAARYLDMLVTALTVDGFVAAPGIAVLRAALEFARGDGQLPRRTVVMARSAPGSRGDAFRLLDGEKALTWRGGVWLGA